MGYQNFYVTKLLTDISASDTAFTVETPPSQTSGRLVLEARNPTQREIIEYTGVSGNQLTGVTRGAGGTTGKTHIKGATVQMNLTADDLTDLYDAFAGLSAGADWLAIPNAVSSIANNGNHSHTVVFNGVDLTTYLSEGMRLRFNRTVVYPTQCADLENSSSQYFSKSSPTGITFTDDFTVEAWIKLESYGAINGIIARKNGTTEGWSMYLETDGRLSISANRIASNNRVVSTNQSVPLGRWVHVAATMDNSANTHTLYIDGVLSGQTITTTGTITALVQGTTALVVGAERSAGTSPFDGKLADVRVWATVRTQQQILDNMNHLPVGNEANLVAAFPLNNSLNDLTANANNLTAQGGATANNADAPMAGARDGETEYGIIMKASVAGGNTTLVVQVPEGYGLPVSGGIDSVYYSTRRAPYRFPVETGKWTILHIWNSEDLQTSPAIGTWYNPGSHKITIPIGSWLAGYSVSAFLNSASSQTDVQHESSLSTSSSSESDADFTRWGRAGGASGTIRSGAPMAMEKNLSLASATDYYFIQKALTGGSPPANMGQVGATSNFTGYHRLYARNGYL